MEFENNGVQPQAETTSSNDNQPNEVKETFEVSGKQMTPEELKKSYLSLHKEFTKRSQELAEFKKSNNSGEHVTREELEEIKQAQTIKAQKEQEAQEFANTFGDLPEKEQKLLKALKKSNPDASYDDIATEYGIISDVELKRAKSNKALVWSKTLGLPSKKAQPALADKIRFKHNYKTSDQINEVRSKFWL